MGTRLYDRSTGSIVTVSDEQLPGAIAAGLKPLDAQQAIEHETTLAPDTSLSAKANALLGEGLNTASFGGSDFLIRQLGTEGERKYHEKVRRDNPGSTLIGGAAGAILDPFSAGKAAAGIGERVAGRLLGEGGGAARQIARSGIASGTEGVLSGAGSALSQVSLSDKPVDLERIASTFSSNMMFGGGIGGAAGSLGKAADIGLRKAKTRLDLIRDGMTASGDVAEDLVGKSKPQLDDLYKAEQTRLADGQTVRKASVVDDATTYRQQVRESNPFLVVEGSELANSTKQIEKALKRPETLAERPQLLAGALEEQGTALKKAIASREKTALRLDELNRKIAKDVTSQIANMAPDAAGVQLTGDAMRRYGHFTDTRVSRKIKSLDVSRDDAARFVDALNNGEVRTSEQRALDGLDGLLESNEALRAKIREVSQPADRLTSDRLSQIGKARESVEAAANRPRSWVEDIAQSSIFGHVAGALSGVPVLGPLVGAKLARGATDLVFGRLGNATAEAAGRASKAIDAFLSVAPKVAKPVPVLASKVLARVRYAEQTDEDRNDTAGAPSARSADLPTLFKKRSAEIRSQTEYGPDGKAVMRPEARQRLAARLAPFAAHDPLTADKLETIAARRLEFLANKLPRRPSIGGIPMGPDKWQPSDLEMRAFARYAAAVEDPSGIVERLASGQVNPEDSEVIRAVYPEIFAEVQARIIEKLPTLTRSLPYSRRISLSIFSGVPVDPAMRPQIRDVLQGQFEEEPGTEGGTQAPKAAPQFGSVSKPNPTPSQERAG